jgi:anti-sigma factor RsiW
MTVSPDILQAFIEGKLAPEEAHRVGAHVAADPDLAAYIEDQKALNAALASPVAAWLRRVSDSIATGTASWIPAAAMAAGIALGVVLAGSFGIGTDMRSENGALVAQGALAQVLTTALPGEENLARSNGTRIGASFWSKNAVFCRTFATKAAAPNPMAGIACREQDAWHIVALAAVASPEEARDAAILPASVRGVMQNLIVGEPLNGGAERQARSQGWRVR